MSESETLSKEIGSVWLAHSAGLHARPAIQLTKMAKRFQAEVWVGVSEDGPWVNSKSIARVMGMKVPSKTTLYFSAEGDDAQNAIRALIKLVENDFTSVADGGE